jgi:hypothetical protein
MLSGEQGCPPRCRHRHRLPSTGLRNGRARQGQGHHHNGVTHTRPAMPKSRACRRHLRCTCNARLGGKVTWPGGGVTRRLAAGGYQGAQPASGPRLSGPELVTEPLEQMPQLLLGEQGEEHDRVSVRCVSRTSSASLISVIDSPPSVLPELLPGPAKVITEHDPGGDRRQLHRCGWTRRQYANPGDSVDNGRGRPGQRGLDQPPDHSRLRPSRGSPPRRNRPHEPPPVTGRTHDRESEAVASYQPEAAVTPRRKTRIPGRFCSPD